MQIHGYKIASPVMQYWLVAWCKTVCPSCLVHIYKIIGGHFFFYQNLYLNHAQMILKITHAVLPRLTVKTFSLSMLDQWSLQLSQTCPLMTLIEYTHDYSVFLVCRMQNIYSHVCTSRLNRSFSKMSVVIRLSVLMLGWKHQGLCLWSQNNSFLSEWLLTIVE